MSYKASETTADPDNYEVPGMKAFLREMEWVLKAVKIDTADEDNRINILWSWMRAKNL